MKDNLLEPGDIRDGRILPQAWALISPYFAQDEIFSPETEGAYHLLDIPSLKLLNDFRDYLGLPLIVNFGTHRRRGVRSLAEQQALGGGFSFHMCGKAFDVSCPKIKLYELAKEAKAFGYTGIGFYGSSRFLHLDTRYSPGGAITTWIKE